MKIFGRDPQWLLSLVGAVVIGVSTFVFSLTDAQQGVINAVAVALVGIVVAFSVGKDGDGQLAAIVGGFKAVIALAIAFGLKLSPDQQAAVMMLVMAIGSGFLRTQLGAPAATPVGVRPVVRMDGAMGGSLR